MRKIEILDTNFDKQKSFHIMTCNHLKEYWMLHSVETDFQNGDYDEEDEEYINSCAVYKSVT